MDEIWILILVSFFATNSLDKAESVQLEELEELPLQTFDELFVEEWWDNEEAEDLQRPPTNFGQIEPNSTDQNPLLTESDHFGQIEPNSTDQNPLLTESDHFGQIEPNSTDQNPLLTESDHFGQIEHNSIDQNPPLTESDHFGQIEPNLTDQNPPLTESDHSDNAKNSEEQSHIMEEISSNKNIAEDEQKRKIVDKFHEMRNKFKQKGKYLTKEWNRIEDKIAKHLKVSRPKIYEWKKEFGISRKIGPNYSDDEKLKIVKKLMQIKRDNSVNLAEPHQINTPTANKWN
uniref:Uncharacterized protein n=1 Tax=Globodera rostochiensis TaxID=31243 RepID=A0A914H6I0_GLORO